MCAVDNLKQIGYTDFGSLDRAYALELRVRLATFFLPSADCVQHVIRFNRCNLSRFFVQL